MLDPADAQQRCLDLIARAIGAGATAGDVVYLAESSESVRVRLGALEDVERSESEQIGLRVFVGKGTASIGSSDLSPAAFDELAARAVAMARAAPDDRFAGLADDSLLLRGPAPELDLVDRGERSPEALRAMALEAEDAARSVAGVSQSEGAGASAGRSVFALATSHGFSGSYAATSRSISASAIAGEGGGMQRDHAWRAARHAADVPPAAEIGALAGTRAAARLAPRRPASGKRSVVFDPRVGSSLLAHLLGAITGPAIARRSSFLLGREGEAIFAADVVIKEDPLRPRASRSRPFDGEGLPTKPRRIVDGGRLTGWLLDTASARQLGRTPTGHASRGGSGAPGLSPGNLVLQAGTASPATLMSDIADGIYVTELMGQGVNPVTGDYSRGASGFRIVRGEIAEPVAEFTIAGNLLEMFAALVPASDLEVYRGIDVPTLRIDGMTVAGS